MTYKNPDDWERFATPLGFIRLILLVDWDPIGVLGYSEAMDEYDSYVPGVYELLAADASQDALVAHLRRIEVERMGVGGVSASRLPAVAAKLRDAFDTARAAAQSRAALANVLPDEDEPH